jgi:hypothetical protein
LPGRKSLFEAWVNENTDFIKVFFFFFMVETNLYRENYYYLPHSVNSEKMKKIGNEIFLDAVEWIRLLYRTLDAFSNALKNNNKVYFYISVFIK